MAHIKQIEIGQDSYLIEPTLYVATTLADDTYSATLTNFTPDTGVSVQIKITDTNPASAKLNINNKIRDMRERCRRSYPSDMIEIQCKGIKPPYSGMLECKWSKIELIIAAWCLISSSY